MAGKLSYGKSAQNKTQADPPLVGYAGELIAAAAGAAPSEPAPPSGMKRGRPPADPNAEPHFFCDEPGCALAYITYGGLYQHRRKHHPWLIAEAKQVAVDEAPSPSRAGLDLLSTAGYGGPARRVAAGFDVLCSPPSPSRCSLASDANGMHSL